MKTTNIFFAVMMITTGMTISCSNQTNQNDSSPTIGMHIDQNQKNSTLVPVMTFSEIEFDFGEVTEGDILKHSFSFTNTGNAPLVIVNAKGSCGCTVTKWPKDPIAPGAKKELLVTFNTNGKPNLQTKQVTLTTNTKEGKQTLKIKAKVTPKAKKTANGNPLSK